jgi:hypothetical protein
MTDVLTPEATAETRAEKIASLNDAARSLLNPEVPTTPFGPFHLVITQGIGALSPEDQKRVLINVGKFDDFEDSNDPHGERDFGAFDFVPESGDEFKVFWKFDYYDRNLEFGSEDPADPKKTTRVLTVMRADEY